MIFGIVLISFSIVLLPLLSYVTFLFYHNLRKLIGMYISEKYYPINNVVYENTPLIPIRTDVHLEEQECGLLIFDVTSNGVSTTQKMYTGSTIGGINIPFANVSFTSRKFYNKKGYSNYGEAKVYLSNMNVRVYCYDEPYRWTLPIHSIVETRISEYGTTVELEKNNTKTKDNFKDISLARYRIKFLSVDEAVYFMNCIWTIKKNGYKFYNELKSNDDVYKKSEYKAITRWDIKRLKNELKLYPELKNKSWIEIEKNIKSVQALDKAHRRVTKILKGVNGEDVSDNSNNK